MPSDKAIQEGIRLLLGSGTKPPEAPPEEAAAAWRVLLPDLTDQELLVAVALHTRSSRNAFWPTPARLLSLVPERPIPVDRQITVHGLHLDSDDGGYVLTLGGERQLRPGRRTAEDVRFALKVLVKFCDDLVDAEDARRVWRELKDKAA